LYAPAKRHSGFSLTELLVALVVAMILMAVGLPAFLRAYHSYQLSTAATQVKDMLVLARYEAIRLNKPVNCVIQPSSSNPGMTNMWADPDKDGVLDPTEKMILLGTSGNLIDSGGVPATSALITQAVGTVPTATPSAGGSVIGFDARGAVTPATTSVNLLYLGSSLAPEAGFRAVVLMPSGSAQVWTADTSGNWQRQQ
jgi:prepilin-type N-terminal cleavage/methylation domain-containing protein